MSPTIYDAEKRARIPIRTEDLIGATVVGAWQDDYSIGDDGLGGLAILLRDGRKINLTGSGQIGVSSIFMAVDRVAGDGQ